MNPLEKLRRQYFPTPEEKLIDELMNDVSSFEVQGWVGSLIDYFAFDPRGATELPEGIHDTWEQLTPGQRKTAFLFLLGAVKALIHPPQEDGDYVGVN